jgi:hypothetical protein
LLIGLSVFTHGGGIPGGSPRPNLLMGMIGSNQIAYLPAHYLQEQNSVSSATFDWTNRSGSASSVNSFPPRKVN